DPALQQRLRGAEAAGQHRITSIERLRMPVNMEEVMQTLASGSDLWVALRIDGRAWNNRSIGTSAVIPDWAGVSGGHAVTLAGFRTTTQGRQFLVHNSWGESWGDKGYAWLNERMLLTFMTQAHKVKMDASARPTAVTDDDCGPDELVDA